MTTLRHPLLRPPALLAATLVAGLVATLAGCGHRAGANAAAAAAPALPATAPERLADTGLYADFPRRTLAASVLSFTPQYPLWTDGAAKRRWILLPPGTAIDASDPDHWRFPVGTRLWKEFAFGRAVETRFMLHTAGGWLYATYVWAADGSDAVLAPERGVRSAIATAGGAHHDIPGVVDCRLCHESGSTAVLGFAALQLSPDRDPVAPHGMPAAAADVDLTALLARGLLQNAPAAWATSPPRIAARSATERAALGYLHGNCSSCHNADGPLQRLGLRFDHPVAAAPARPPAIATTVGVASHFRRGEATQRIAAGDPDRSVLMQRLRATDALTQMPPFGRHLADDDAVALIAQWIRNDLLSPASLADHQSPPRKQE